MNVCPLRKRWLWVGLLVGGLLGLQAGPAWAIFLDTDESLRFSGRVYNRHRLFGRAGVG